MTLDNYEIIFQEWKAALKDKDRSTDYVQSNFEELFENLKVAGASFEEAHKILPAAIKAHSPTDTLVRVIFKRLKSNLTEFKNEKEFAAHWIEDIGAKGTNALFSVFPRPKGDSEADEPKVNGNMSVKEYKAQRRHADQYPVLNTEELEKKMLKGTYNPLEDISNILSKKVNNG